MSNDLQRASWPGWETVRLIGRGSFGEVYEIQRNLFGNIEKAALKLISIPQNSSDIDEMYGDGFDNESITSAFDSHLKSIVAEYSLMKKMSSCVNIVNCDDVRYVRHEDGVGWDIFIKMELLTPLTKSLPTNIPDALVQKLALDLCSSLIACRELGVIHRDIKPQNIFVSERGNYKLGDFGISKTVEKTMGGTKIGTYKYMAPEVYHNQPYGSAADLYSLGLVLYWMLNERRMPFLPLPPETVRVGVDEVARNRRLSGEQIPPPLHGSEELKRIVLKACAFEPKDRYASAAEMKRDLESLVYGHPTQAPQSIRKRVVGIPVQVDVVSEQPAEEEETIVSAQSTEQLFTQNTTSHTTHQALKHNTEDHPRSVKKGLLFLLVGVLVCLPVILFIKNTNPEPLGILLRNRIDFTKVRTLTFYDTLTNAPKDAVDASVQIDRSVLVWFQEISESLYDVYIAGEGGVLAPTDCSELFSNCYSLEAIHNIEYLDMSQVTTTAAMFSGCINLKKLDLSRWDISNVTDMNHMFWNCTSLNYLELGWWWNPKSVKTWENCRQFYNEPYLPNGQYWPELFDEIERG